MIRIEANIDKTLPKPTKNIIPKIEWQIINKKIASQLNKTNPDWVYYGVDKKNYYYLTQYILETNKFLEKQNNVINTYESMNQKKSSNTVNK